MNRIVLIVAILILLIVGGVAYTERGVVRDWATAATAPSLPPAQPYLKKIQPAPAQMPEQTSVVEGGVATSTHYRLESSPSSAPPVQPKTDPFAVSAALPSSVNLDVPFTSQSPYAKWTPQDEEACEEAAAYMVDQFYRGKTGVLDVAASQKALDGIVAYEKKTIGYFEDTSATTTAQWISGYMGYSDIRIVPFQESKLRQALANGFPVIIPASGKLLQNPNFQNGGPPFHMVVVKGYTEDGKYITNDSGTRNGHNYIYTPQILTNAAHDWNNGDVIHGAPLMMVVMPST